MSEEPSHIMSTLSLVPFWEKSCKPVVIFWPLPPPLSRPSLDSCHLYLLGLLVPSIKYNAKLAKAQSGEGLLRGPRGALWNLGLVNLLPRLGTENEIGTREPVFASLDICFISLSLFLSKQTFSDSEVVHPYISLPLPLPLLPFPSPFSLFLSHFLFCVSTFKYREWICLGQRGSSVHLLSNQESLGDGSCNTPYLRELRSWRPALLKPQYAYKSHGHLVKCKFRLSLGWGLRFCIFNSTAGNTATGLWITCSEVIEDGPGKFPTLCGHWFFVQDAEHLFSCPSSGPWMFIPVCHGVGFMQVCLFFLRKPFCPLNFFFLMLF